MSDDAAPAGATRVVPRHPWPSLFASLIGPVVGATLVVARLAPPRPFVSRNAGEHKHRPYKARANAA